MNEVTIVLAVNTTVVVVVAPVDAGPLDEVRAANVRVLHTEADASHSSGGRGSRTSPAYDNPVSAARRRSTGLGSRHLGSPVSKDRVRRANSRWP